MNFDTAFGKTVKTLIWVAVSAAVTAVIAFITKQPQLFSPTVVAAVGLVNALLVGGKNVADPNVKNI